MNDAQIRAMQEQFERERDEWEGQKAALEKEAQTRGLVLVSTLETRSIEMEWEGERAFVVRGQSCGHRFEPLARLPKAYRPICGAKTRSGGACRMRVCDRTNGTWARRCRLHGGLSTGPKTKQGREAIRAANQARVKSRKTVLSSG